LAGCADHGSSRRDLPANKIGGECRQPAETTLAELNAHKTAHHVAGVREIFERW
jgi:hypothetical protein